MYMSPNKGSPRHKGPVPSGPIAEFMQVIEHTPSDEWQKRTKAMQSLVDSIPEGPKYYDNEAWYNTAPVLRHLAFPIAELLKDARSTVVKRTCDSLTQLFNKCQADGRYLFRDIMPAILAVHAQTVQVIRQAVQTMVLESIPEVPCKMVMPLWMDRLKVDKSRTVREACALYLGQALQSWTEEGYLTEEIWLQVGTTLIKSLRDPSAPVRAYAREALEVMRSSQPSSWEKLLDDPAGPAFRDIKIQRWLRSLGQGSPDAEELSVASKFSYNSDSRFATMGAYRLTSPSKRVFSAQSPRAPTIENDMVPRSIDVNTPNANPWLANNTTNKSKKTNGTGIGPPLRPATQPSQEVVEEPVEQQQPSLLLSLGTPPRPPNRNGTSVLLTTIQDSSDSHSEEVEQAQSSPQFPSDLNGHFQAVLERAEMTIKEEEDEDKAYESEVTIIPEALSDDRTLEIKDEVSRAVEEGAGEREKATDSKDEGPFIASVRELKRHASLRRSRNSLMMAERFRMSGSVSMDDDEERKTLEQRSDEENVIPNPFDTTTTNNTNNNYVASAKSPVQAPEHMVIAVRMLRAHKAHVDRIMETLKMEMDALRDFDRLLEEPGRPTEDEVLDYFESVGLCLDQRTQAGAKLQNEMDRISRGDLSLG